MISNGMKSLSSPCPPSSIWEKRWGNLKPAVPMPMSQLGRVGAHISPPDNRRVSLLHRTQAEDPKSPPRPKPSEEALQRGHFYIYLLLIRQSSVSLKVQPLVFQHAWKVEAKRGKRSNRHYTRQFIIFIILCDFHRKPYKGGISATIL